MRNPSAVVKIADLPMLSWFMYSDEHGNQVKLTQQKYIRAELPACFRELVDD